MRRLNLPDKQRKIFLLLVFSLSFIVVQGQDNTILYGFRAVQQGNYLNPAFTSKAKIVIGFPGLSNLDFRYLNTAGSFNNILKPENNLDSIPIDLLKIINQGHPIDQINASVNQDLLYAGFRVGKLFLSLGVKQRIFLRAFLPDELFKLAWYGNAPNVGQTLDLSSMAVNENHFIDYHAGASIPVAKRLTVGLRLHLMQGLSNIHTVNNFFRITSLDTTQNADNIGVNANVVVNTAGLPDTSDFDPVAYFKNFKNLGFSLDFGMDFKVTNQVELSAALLNLGTIRFKEKTKTYQSKVNNIHFNSDQFDLFDLSDTLKDLLHVDELSQNYRIKLPVRVLFGGEYYSRDRRNRTSILLSGRFYPGHFEPAVSLAFDRTISKNFSMKVAYTYLKYNPINVGVSLALNVKSFQFYLYTDNVLGAWWNKQRLLQVGFGLNIRIPSKEGFKTVQSKSPDS